MYIITLIMEVPLDIYNCISEFLSCQDRAHLYVSTGEHPVSCKFVWLGRWVCKVHDEHFEHLQSMYYESVIPVTHQNTYFSVSSKDVLKNACMIL